MKIIGSICVMSCLLLSPLQVTAYDPMPDPRMDPKSKQARSAHDRNRNRTIERGGVTMGAGGNGRGGEDSTFGSPERRKREARRNR